MKPLKKVSTPIVRCIVWRCKNASDAGTIIGDLCVPCDEFITTGKGVYSQAYRNALTVCKNIIDDADPTFRKKDRKR